MAMQIPASTKVFFDNIFEFRQDFTDLLKDLDNKPVLTSVKNPQDNSLAEQLHQVTGCGRQASNRQAL